MNNKIQRLRDELSRNVARMDALRNRNMELEEKIRDEENLAFRNALARANITFNQGIALVESLHDAKEDKPTPTSQTTEDEDE